MLRQPHFSNSLSWISKTVIFSLKFSKNDPIRHLWWLVSETRMHRLPESMFLLNPRQDHISSETKKIFRCHSLVFRFEKQ